MRAESGIQSRDESGMKAGLKKSFRSQRVVAAAGVCLLTCVPGFFGTAALAQDTTQGSGGAATRFAIRGFQLEGENPLTQAETTQVLAPFLSSEASIETLQKATAALETLFRDRGFGLHRVSLPPQELGDRVRLDIVKFTISKVTVSGRQKLDESNIRSSVPELQEGATPNFKRLAIQTGIANENQGKQIQVALKESVDPDKIDANVVVTEGKPWNFSVSLANTGSPSSGRDRLTFAGGYANLFNRDHQLVGAYTTSVERTNDVKQIGLNYRIPFYALGGVLSASYTQSDVVGDFGTFSSTGAGRTVGLQYTQHLAPDKGYRGFWSLAVDDRVFDPTQINGVVVPGSLSRRSRPFSVGYTGRSDSDTVNWGYNAELAANVVSGSGNNLAAYQAEDPRIYTASWRAVRGGANYLGYFSRGWLLGVRGQFQYSGNALISGEQFGVGGAGSVRGTSERALSADRGLFASVEVTTPELVTGFRLLSFVDLGSLSNVNSNGPAKPFNDQIQSVGLGLRYAGAAFSLSADYGRIVQGSVVPLTLNSSSPQRDSEKVHVNISARF